ncbi:MAG: CDP-diacylglycerol--glycerol-3-phosphate 3-phosphatidyltransferase [Frankiaceae bacterium]
MSAEKAPVDDRAVPAAAPILNIANYLTVLRLALVPVLLVLLLADGGHRTGWRIAAALAFAAASITDRIDGDLARSRGLVTDFGKVADPIADKALTGAALIGLSVLGDLAWAITIAVLVREIGITAMRFWVIRHGVIPASRGGKVKTLLQSVAIGLYILPLPDWLHPATLAVMLLALAVTYVTGADYVLRAVRLRRTSERTARRLAARR